ncbi:MAG TPA: efflux RND transporter periplasmic adaptor subunit [Fimbriimonadaceae bacterium]|nr:efflux RND transporter periplasmic adaptor subunit [Fimbriimonadaceae bacterium]
MQIKKWLAIGLPLLVVGSLVGWRFVQKGQQEQELQQTQQARQGAVPAVEVAVAGPETIVASLSAVGTAESLHRVEISPKTSGRIEYLQVREGDQVRRGEVLVRIDPSELQAQVLQQQAALAEARSRLARAQINQAPTEVGVQSQIQQQRAALSSAQAEFTQVQRNQEAQIAAADAGVADARSKLTGAEAQVRNAEAELNRQQANLKNSEARLARVEELYRQGFIAAQEVDDARTAVEVQRRSVDVARGQVQAAQSAVSSAQSQVKAAESQAAIVRRTSTAAIETARARVRQAEAAVDVATANRAQSPAYRQNIAALASSVKAAEAQLAQARARLSETTLRSPIDGVVTARMGDPGALASPGQPVVVVQSMGSIYVSASVALEESAQAIVGTQVEVRFDALPDDVFRGPISHVNPAADLQSRRVSFRVLLDNPAQRIKPGMFGRVEVPTRRVAAEVTVPREALRTTPDGAATVTVVDAADNAHVREVETGAANGRYVQITRGIQAGERVVTLAYRPVRDGQKVSVGRPEQGERGAVRRGNS